MPNFLNAAEPKNGRLIYLLDVLALQNGVMLAIAASSLAGLPGVVSAQSQCWSFEPRPYCDPLRADVRAAQTNVFSGSLPRLGRCSHSFRAKTGLGVYSGRHFRLEP